MSPELAESGGVPELRCCDVERLRTSLAPLRSSATPPPQGAPVLAEMPLRVAAQPDGCFEVLDGFKRLAHWIAAGRREVPIVVEQAGSAIDQKLLLLRANAPPRRTTAMDEARVVDSLVLEDQQSESAIARRLGRRTAWVSRRLVLARRLAPSLQGQLDRGQIGPSVAYALCGLPHKDQEALEGAARRDRLTTRQSLALIATFRSATASERVALLAEPLETVSPDPPRPALGPLCVRLEERLRRIQQALLDLASFEIPTCGLSPAERRRVEAQHLATLDRLHTTARAAAVPPVPAPTHHTQEEEEDERREPEVRQERRERRDADRARPEPGSGRAELAAGAEPAAGGFEGPRPRAAPADPRCLRAPRHAAQDRPRRGPRPQDGAPGPRAGGGEHRHDPPLHGPGQQARPLPRDDSRQGRQAPHRHPHPARDP